VIVTMGHQPWTAGQAAAAEHGHEAAVALPYFLTRQWEAQHAGPDGVVPPPDAAANSGEHATASPPASPAQIHDQALIRLAVITEEWQKARDALRSG
jgi:hypothetical protein